MTILAILGSRSHEGQTARAVDALLDAAAAKGCHVDHAFLPQMHIERCRQCDANGWGLCRSEGRCIIEDNFAALVARIAEADVVVFGVPVYFSDLPESARAFLDRLRRVRRHENGPAGVKGKPAVGICVAGGGGGGAPSCCVSLEKVLATCGFDIVDMVPVRRQNLDYKCRALALAGEWLAQNG